MSNRYLHLKDKNGTAINEGDQLQIDAKNISEKASFWHSNMGEFLKKNNFDQVLIAFHNHGDLFKISARFSFYPLKLSSEVVGHSKLCPEEYFSNVVDDYSFITYLISAKVMEKVNKDKTEGEAFGSDLKLGLQDSQGNEIKSSDTIIFPLNEEFSKKVFQAKWLEEKILPNNVVATHLFLSEKNGTELRAKTKYMKADGNYLSTRDVYGANIGFTEAELNEDHSNGFLFDVYGNLVWYLNQAIESRCLFYIQARE